MANLNKVLLIGRVGREPDLRETTGGKSVANFSVATNDNRDNTEWHSVVVWDKLADTCAKYCTKGKLVYVEGRIQTRSWEADGEKKYKTEVVAHSVQFLSFDKPVSDKPDFATDDEIPF